MLKIKFGNKNFQKKEKKTFWGKIENLFIIVEKL
jgi:hypothetical protein